MIVSNRKYPKEYASGRTKITKNCVGVSIIATVIIFVAIIYFYHTIFNNKGPKKYVLQSTRAASKAVNKFVGNIDDFPFEVSARQILFEIDGGGYVDLIPKKPFSRNVVIKIVLDDPTLIDTMSTFVVKKDHPGKIHIPLHSKGNAGECILSFKTTKDDDTLRGLYKVKINIKVVHNIYFGYLSIFIGWVCFIMWSVSFYPQFWTNYTRKSVVGLSLDYVTINTMGHFSYLIFNATMYCNHFIQQEYAKLHPRSDLPVKLNDVFFSIHASIIMTLLCVQCIHYERGNQKVSIMSYSFVGVCVSFLGASIIAAMNGHITWMNAIYYFSYVKVLVTPVKYTPQVYLNWKRKTTEGFNIKGCIMDFFGSLSNTLQMVIDSFNHDNLDETFGNPGKLLLGLIGIMYNFIFLSQRFIFFGPNKENKNTLSL